MLLPEISGFLGVAAWISGYHLLGKNILEWKQFPFEIEQIVAMVGKSVGIHLDESRFTKMEERHVPVTSDIHPSSSFLVPYSNKEICHDEAIVPD